MSKILWVFDINGTLLKRPSKIFPTKENITFRPYLNRLVKFLHTHNYNYIFWTNAHPDVAFQLYKLLIEFGFTRSKGVKHFYDCKLINKVAVKDLRIFRNESYLIDDSRQKNVETNNYIHIPKFVSGDCEILKLIEKLHLIEKCKCDISELLKI
ncbi:hypothetical protein DMUE_4033 [Dictyocoela muelleri]|nr:hypothetical protein DMUE_4033 [Dictyocoela muelleri]